MGKQGRTPPPGLPRRMARRQHPQWHLGFSALLLGAAILAALVVNWQSPSPEPVAQLPPSRPPEKTDAYTLGDSLYAQVETVLDELGIWPALNVKTRSHQSSVDSVSITVPAADLSAGMVVTS